MTIRCAICGADPCGRWKQPPAMIFIDPYRENGGSKYRCGAHVSPKKEEELRRRERERGWPEGTLR